MFEIEKNYRVKELISITKSNSGICGPKLAMAHMELGRLLGREFHHLDSKDTTIIAIMRGGIFFAEGLYFELGCKFQTFDPKRERFIRPATKNVILVDSVVNTGKTIKKIIEPDMFVACCVINEQAVALFDSQLYTIRVSRNSFVGTNVLQQNGNVGPDTTMRLFNLL